MKKLMKSTKFNSNKAITLIALIITIIVLLILAGISVNLLMGENGILQHAATSSEQYAIEAEREELRLNIVAIQTEILKTEGRQATPEDLKAKLEGKYDITLINEEIASSEKVTPKAIGAKVVKKGSTFQFTVDEKLVITKVEVIGKEDVGDENLSQNLQLEKKITYLYKNGNQYEEITGGYIGHSDKSSEAIIKDNYLYTNITYKWFNFAYFLSNNKINIKEYDVIKVKVSTGDEVDGSGNWFSLIISNKNPLQEDDSQVWSDSIGGNKENYILEFKIPEFANKEDVYLGFGACLKDVKVEEIWVEQYKKEKKYIYNEGKLGQGISGFNIEADVNGFAEVRNNCLYSTVTSEGGCNFGGLITNEMVDLTGWDKVCIEATTGGEAPSPAGNWLIVGLNENQKPLGYRVSQYYTYESDYNSHFIAPNSNRAILKYTIPEQAKNGKYYIGTAGCVLDAKVYKIWLEKIVE